MTSYVISAGVSSAYVVGFSDTLTVLGGGTSQESRVGNGGVEIVSSGAQSINDSFASGAIDVFDRGAYATGVYLSRGSVLALVDLNIANGEVFYIGAAVSQQEVESGITLAGGAAAWSVDAVLANGGIEIVKYGGVAVDTSVVSGTGIGVAAGGIVNGAKLQAGGEVLISGAGSLTGMITDGGAIVSGQVLGGAHIDVGHSGSLVSAVISSGATVSVVASGLLQDDTVLAGATLTLNRYAHGLDLALAGGQVTGDGALFYHEPAPITLRGGISGKGSLIDEQAKPLTVSANMTGFDGYVSLEEGTLKVAAATGLGTGTVGFYPDSSTLTLRVEAADMPANGARYASQLEFFDQVNDRLDLPGLAFVSGATAVVHGAILTLQDGAYTASFKLALAESKSYAVAKDAVGGVVIHPTTDATTNAMVQAMAGFAATPTIQTNRLASAPLESGIETSLAQLRLVGPAGHEFMVTGRS